MGEGGGVTLTGGRDGAQGVPEGEHVPHLVPRWTRPIVGAVHTWHSVEEARLGEHEGICALVNDEALRVPSRFIDDATEMAPTPTALPVRLVMLMSNAPKAVYHVMTSSDECRAALERDLHVEPDKRDTEPGRRRHRREMT